MRNCVPANWDVAELRDIAEARSGYGFPESLQGRTNGEVPFFKVGDISRAVLSHRDLLTTAQHYITEEEAAQIGARVLPKDTVVFAKIGEAVKLNRRAALAQDSLVDNNVMGLIPNSAVVPTYLLHFMRTVDLGVLSQATTVPSVRKGDVQRVKIPIAPMGEQRRIVEAIESYLTRLDNAVALLERVEQNLKRYRTSILKAAVEGRLVPTEAELARREGREYEPASELLKRILAERKARWIEDAAEKARAKAEEKARKAGQPWTAKDDAATLEKERAKAAKQYKEPHAPETTDLADLPEGWCWVSPRQLFSWASGEFLPRSQQREGSVPVYGGNGVTGHHDVALVDTPTLIIGRVGAQCGNVHVARGSAWITDNAIYASEGGARADLDYWQMVLSVEDLNAGAAGTGQPYVNQTHLNALRVPFPPKDEQARIVGEVNRLLSVADGIRGTAAVTALRSVRLRQSILKWAFEGKLAEQDPNDEPASVLLERIRAEQTAASAPQARMRRERSAE